MGFASPWFPLGALTLPLSVFIPPLYAGQLGLGVSLAGALILASRIFDIVIDPLIGLLSDASSNRHGGRGRWILAGLPIYCIGVWLLFNPPTAIDGASGSLPFAAARFLLALILSAAGSSLMLVPHAAWSSELSDDGYQRARIMGANEWLNLVGIFGVVILGAVLEQTLHADLLMQMRWVGWLLIATAPITVMLCLRSAGRHPTRTTPPGAGRLIHASTPRERFGALLAKPYLCLSAAKFINSVAESITQALWVFVCATFLDLGAQSSTLLAVHVGMGLVSIPLWTTLSRSLGKAGACIGALLWRIALTPLILVLPAGNLSVTGAFMAVVGLSLGAESSLLRAMVADVAEDRRQAQGAQLAGTYQGTFNVISNLGKALGIGLIYPLLGALGYSRHVLDTTTTALGDSAWAPVVFYALVPPALNLLGTCFLFGYMRLTLQENALFQPAMART